MRCAIISDIHANLEALRAVLDDIQQRGGADKYWHLGDVAGYGPDPHACIETLRQLDHIAVAGNHDLAAIGKIGTEAFNPDAAESARWTATQLTASDTTYLETLPVTVTEADFTLVHGSPRDPIWEYLLDTDRASRNFAFFQTRFCLVGHTHAPMIFKSEADGQVSARRFSDEVVLSGRDRMIINPGGVGQPRDGDPRAAYAIYDSEAGVITPYRVAYDIAATQAKMRKLELPSNLIIRLSYGR